MPEAAFISAARASIRYGCVPPDSEIVTTLPRRSPAALAIFSALAFASAIAFIRASSSSFSLSSSLTSKVTPPIRFAPAADAASTALFAVSTSFVSTSRFAVAVKRPVSPATPGRVLVVSG